MNINIGSGYKKYKDYINLDADFNCNPDILFDLENDIFPFEDSSIDKVIAHHILEHIGDGYFHVLKELYRICKHGAIIDIRAPHHNHEVFHNDPTHKRPITVEGMRLFSKKYNKYEIDRGGSSSTLGIIYNIDFEIVAFDYVYDSFYNEIFKTNTQTQNIRLCREFINTTLETHIIITPIKDVI